MAKTGIMFVMVLGTLTLSAENSWARGGLGFHDSGFHDVHVYHPMYGHTTMGVHEGSVGARHPEASVRCEFGGYNC